MYRENTLYGSPRDGEHHMEASKPDWKEGYDVILTVVIAAVFGDRCHVA